MLAFSTALFIFGCGLLCGAFFPMCNRDHHECISDAKYLTLAAVVIIIMAIVAYWWPL